MTEQNVNEIHNNMIEELKKYGAKIDRIYYCPHKQGDNCECRKPNPGMLFRAASENNFDLTKAIFIGDDERDIEAGRTARCRTMLINPENNLLKIVNSIIKPRED